MHLLYVSIYLTSLYNNNTSAKTVIKKLLSTALGTIFCNVDTFFHYIIAVNIIKNNNTI